MTFWLTIATFPSHVKKTHTHTSQTFPHLYICVLSEISFLVSYPRISAPFIMSVCFIFNSPEFDKPTSLVMSTAISCMYHEKSNCTSKWSIELFQSILFFFPLSAPLQSIGLNGRNNRVFVSPSSSSFIQQTVLPNATSLQSLPTLPPNSTVQNSSTKSSDQEEKERLKTDLIQLKSELQKSKETIVRLQKSEEQMRER